MKSFLRKIIPALVLSLCACTAHAADLTTLDRVSVLMPKVQVLSILGAPDQVADMGGIMVDLYRVSHTEPLVSVGYFYEQDLILDGHSFIFRGDVAAPTAARMKDLGFTAEEAKGDCHCLTGTDDDTGRPIIVTICRSDELTLVTTFEKGFYERRAGK